MLPYSAVYTFQGNVNSYTGSLKKKLVYWWQFTAEKLVCPALAVIQRNCMPFLSLQKSMNHYSFSKRKQPTEGGWCACGWTRQQHKASHNVLLCACQDQRLLFTVHGTRSNGTMRGSTYTLVRRLEEMAEMDTRLGLDSAHARTRREKLLPAFDSLTRGPWLSTTAS
jgi:hypothetical protein